MAYLAEYLPADAGPPSVDATTEIRVCHIMSADLWAGAEVQVATVASYLVEQADVKLSAVLLNEGRLAHELRRLGVQVAIVDESQHSAVGILIFLIRFLREKRVEIVHTHRCKDTVLGAIAAKLAGVRYVIRTVHGLSEPMRGWDWAKYQVYESLDKATLWCFADRIIAVSQRMADTLKASGYRRITQIYNGIDLRKMQATRVPEDVRRELGVGSRALLIGTVGRLSPVKGHADLLRAARRILQREPDARFLIVGGGPLKDQLLASARNLGVDDACLFVGPRADVCDLIAAMDIFLLPSLDEGIPMALLEAMALERPVVATAVGGVPEIVTHRASGLLVKPRDEQALADACLELARDRDWARRLGAQARRVVEEKFAYERSGGAVAAVYRGLALADRARGNRTRFGALPRLWGFARRLLSCGRRKLGDAVERRRMRRLRQDPAVLTTALKSARSVLIVCHGNTIRSAFAARLVTQTLGDNSPVSIFSGGLTAVPGRPPHPTAVLVAITLRVDLSHHTASPVVPEAVASADVIFVMDIPQLVVMRTRFPEARAKTFLLTCLAPETPMEIRDPVNGDAPRFEACFDHISRAVRPIVRILSDVAQSAGAAHRLPLPATPGQHH